jgi:hypothetical protein
MGMSQRAYDLGRQRFTSKLNAAMNRSVAYIQGSGKKYIPPSVESIWSPLRNTDIPLEEVLKRRQLKESF